MDSMSCGRAAPTASPSQPTSSKVLLVIVAVSCSAAALVVLAAARTANPSQALRSPRRLEHAGTPDTAAPGHEDPSTVEPQVDIVDTELASEAAVSASVASLEGNLTALWGPGFWGSRGSCAAYGCSSGFRWGQLCGCNPICTRVGMCCSDYLQVCAPAQEPSQPAREGSCQRYGCGSYEPGRDCQCSEQCRFYGNCCSDHSRTCHSRRPPASASCEASGCGGRYNPHHPCQCTDECKRYGNCCADYQDVCHVAPAPRPAPRPSPVPVPAPPPPASHQPSSGEMYTFYAYRAQSDSNYPPKNVNAANLAGVVWYLQHEVMATSPPKFGVTRILRYKIHTKAPHSLLSKGMNFGVRYAYDSQKCTGPGKCSPLYSQYGHFVGCNKFESHYPYPTEETHFPGGIWYSFPEEGACSNLPTGTPDCTYSYEWPPQEVSLEELQGGKGKHFWDGHSMHVNTARVQDLASLFNEKYPASPHLHDPVCDFDYGKFWN